MKLYEYAAAGLPVLARFTPELERRHESFLFTYRDTPDMIQQFHRLITEPRPHAVSATDVAGHSWQQIACRLLEFANSAERPWRDREG
jgi:hypothetical protein